MKALCASLLLVAPLLPIGSASPVGLARDISPGSGVVVVKAGTIHLVEDDRVLEDGVLLIEDGRIAAVAESAEFPGVEHVVDYGPDAVIIPGLVSADSFYSYGSASRRTADPAVRAVDHFDPYSDSTRALVSGVTSFYVAPARGRLIAGQGAAVKSAGKNRILSDSTGLHGSISSDARRTPGYWDPPIPATVDQGMGVARPQLPRSTMGAIVALQEVLALARGGEGEQEYGRLLAGQLAPLLEAKKTWRMGAQTEAEIRALVDAFAAEGLPLVIDGAREAGEVAQEIATAGFPVIVSISIPENSTGRDFGKDKDRAWPRYDTASVLAEAGVRVAVSVGGNADLDDLRLAAAIARRGGLDAPSALRAITLEPARILGIDQRVGSLAVGKDADLCVLSGDPTSVTSSVVASWIDGEVAWKTRATGSVVIEVEELHVGDGQVLAPGQLLMKEGKIVEVGRSVSRPAGATVVRGHAAMPGMIDALGFLGLEGSDKGISPRVQLSRIVEPGDATDRRVARAGVTTVNLGSRSNPGDGSPTMAYKPAGSDLETMVVGDPNALRMQWSDDNRHESGEKVLKALEKAKKYKTEWEEYEKEIAAWEPPEPKANEDEEEDEDEDDEEEEEEDSKSKKKKDKGAPAPPVTGVWEGTLNLASGTDSASLRLRLLEEDGSIEGALRCSLLTEGLVDLDGTREEDALTLEASGTRGPIGLSLEVDDDELAGKVEFDGQALDVTLEQTSSEYKVARRRPRPKPPAEDEPKGKPRSPGIDPELEPLRRAMSGKAAVLVHVEREDEILDCVSTFENFGIRPVLVGATKVWEVASDLSGRIAGVIPTHRALQTGGKLGISERQLHAVLRAAGIPTAFHSAAEEGAADLPLIAAHAVAHGLSPQAALQALTSDAAQILSISDRVGTLAVGLDADVLLLDGSPLEVSSRVLRVWVSGEEVR